MAIYKKLDVYFLIDISASMYGEPIVSINEAFKTIVDKLRCSDQNFNFNIVERIKLCVSSYNSQTVDNLALTTLNEIGFLEIGPATGLTNSGKAIKHTLQKLNDNITSNGNYLFLNKPPLFIHLTDGNPTDIDQYEEVTNGLYDIIAVNKIGCAIGQYVELNYLKKFSNQIVLLEKNDNDSINQFAIWISELILYYLLSDDDNLNNVFDLIPIKPQNPSLTSRLKFVNFN